MIPAADALEGFPGAWVAFRQLPELAEVDPGC